METVKDVGTGFRVSSLILMAICNMKMLLLVSALHSFVIAEASNDLFLGIWNETRRFITEI